MPRTMPRNFNGFNGEVVLTPPDADGYEPRIVVDLKDIYDFDKPEVPLQDLLRAAVTAHMEKQPVIPEPAQPFQPQEGIVLPIIETNTSLTDQVAGSYVSHLLCPYKGHQIPVVPPNCSLRLDCKGQESRPLASVATLKARGLSYEQAWSTAFDNLEKDTPQRLTSGTVAKYHPAALEAKRPYRYHINRLQVRHRFRPSKLPLTIRQHLS